MTPVVRFAALWTRRELPRGVVPAQRAFTLLELLLAVAILGVIAAASVPAYEKYRDRVDVARAKADIRTIEQILERYRSANNSSLPDTLAQAGAGSMKDPWGNPYQYLNIETAQGKGAVRKDHKLVPINSDYDLYSKGKDGDSKPPLTAKASQDDVIRANDGRFVGLASDY
jgi:general secretion pathway protein G